MKQILLPIEKLKVKTRRNQYQSSDGLLVTYNQKIVELYFDDESYIYCTNDHMISTPLGFVRCRDLKNGQKVCSETGTKTLIYKENTNRKETTYDLTNVANGNCYLANDTEIKNCIVLDEFAFVLPHVADEFISSVYPTITSGQTTKMVVISTPKGMNHFHKIWIDAKNRKNSFVAVEARWNEIPGRNEKFKKDTIANIGEQKWAQEFECAFLGSQHTLISASAIANMVYLDPIYSNEEGLCVYEEPEPGHIYTLTVDCGKGNEQDYHAFSVIDCTKMPYKQVARFKNNRLPYQIFPSFVEKIAKKYNQAYVLFELNDLGVACANILRDELEYENMVQTSTKGKSGQRADGGFGGKAQNGVTMSGRVKKEGCSVLKSMIEGGKLEVFDYDTITEFSTFIAVKDSYAADEGYHDDIMTTLVLFSWLSTQQFFKDITDTDLRRKLYENQLKRLEDEILPFGFYNNGIDEEPDPVDIWDERTPQQKTKDNINLWKD